MEGGKCHSNVSCGGCGTFGGIVEIALKNLEILFNQTRDADTSLSSLSLHLHTSDSFFVFVLPSSFLDSLSAVADWFTAEII